MAADSKGAPRTMRHIDNDEFVCIDCEMTGLDAEKDQIIEVAFMRFKGKEVIDSFETLIDPECVIPEASMVFHKISQDMVQGKPKIAEVLPELLKRVGRTIIVGHGVTYDVALLARDAKRAGLPCTLESNQIIDTLRMARLYGESPINSLEQLRQHFHIAEQGAHRAMSDVLVNVEVFQYLARNYHSTKQLLEVLSRPIALKAMPLGKHKGRAMKDIPLEYLLWMANKDFDQDLLFSIRSEIKKRKKGNQFGQVSNPFADL